MITERALTDSDRDWLAVEIANDPLHSGLGMTPDSFLAMPHTFSVCTEDEDGPLFVVRFSNVLKADIQFCRKQASRKRIVAAFMEQFPKVVQSAKSKGYKRLLVNTESYSLKRWCQKHLGFLHFRDDLSRML